MTYDMVTTANSSTLQSRLHNFGNESDVHGLREILKRDIGIARRVCWIVIFTVALSFMAVQMHERVQFYIAKHHITKTDVLFEHSLDFPAITVCNMNKYRISQITREDIVHMGTVIGLTNENYYLHHSEYYDQKWVTDMFARANWRVLTERYSNASYSVKDFVNRTQHRFEDMIVACQWKDEPCVKDDWIEQLTHLGICYTFNQHAHISRNISKSGNGNGLKLVLNVEESEYLELPDQEDIGFKILMHHQSEPPFVKELGFGVTTGFHYLIAMQMKELVSLPHPYGSCLVDGPTDHYKCYSVPACRIECETRLINNTCSCRLVESPGEEIPICTSKQYKCAIEALYKLEADDHCACANPCNSIQYSSAVSSLRLRRETVAKLNRLRDKEQQLTIDDVAVLNIYYQALSYELIEQVPAYTLIALLSDIGGNFGLYMGGSILATLQLVDWIVRACYHHCADKQVDKSSTSKASSNGHSENSFHQEFTSVNVQRH